MIPTNLVALLLLSLNPLSLFPDSVEVTIRNEIADAPITSIHYLIAGSWRMVDAGLEEAIAPGNHAVIRLPYRFLLRIVFGTDTRGNYRKESLPLKPSGDTLTVSRADREFGGVFDVILGEHPLAVRNRTTVPITQVFLHGEGLPEHSVLGRNPLMTDEILFLWLDRDSVTITATDIQGNVSRAIPLARTDRDSIHAISIGAFLRSAPAPSDDILWFINGINGERITGIEVYPVMEEPFYLDLTDAPLELWEHASVAFRGDIDHIVFYDGHGRSYTLDQRDPVTGAYIADWWHLDFDFRFPERKP